MHKWSFQTLFWITQSSALCLCFVPPLFFFLFLIFFISKMHTHTHTHVYVLPAGSLTQSCLTLCNPMNCSLPNGVYRILQVRILEWVAMFFSICTNSFQKRSLMYTFYLNAHIAYWKTASLLTNSLKNQGVL